MDLTTKSKLDLVDSHLWGQTAKFFFSCQIRHIPKFFGILSDISMNVQAHGDESDSDDYYVMLTFKPEVMQEGRTADRIATLLSIAGEVTDSITVDMDEYGGRIDGAGNLLESWAKDS